MPGWKNRLYAKYSGGVRLLFLNVVFIGLIGCVATLPEPTGPDSTIMMLSIEAKRNLVNNNPDSVTIIRQEDNQEFSHSVQDGKYYFFTNIPKGTYRIKAASILIQGGTTSTTSGNFTSSFSTSVTNAFPFSQQHIEASSTQLSPGKLAFMGSITAEGTSKLFPPGAIEISNIELSKSEQARNKAFEYFKEKFKESPWISYM